jgi:predicted metal-binding protein
MPKHTLFVCKSCHRSSEERPEDRLLDGSRLLDRLNSLFSEQFKSDELEIKPVECLWACSRGCVVAVKSLDKPTYLFVDLPLDKSDTALLEFANLYIESAKGIVPWKKLPELLQSSMFAQIPPLD